ncbi:MAG: hypothetical protein IPN67_08920 [Bacteroidales bacterium]|nr:hypothetical protein [Bacteroidales bacterium]
MVKRLLTGLLLVIVFGSASGQEIMFPELSGYRKNTDFQVFGPDNLWDFINGAAETYLTYGFADLHIAEYKKGKNVIKLEIYRHIDHIMAFGIYSTERSPSFNYMKIGAQGYVTDGSINFFKGNYYVKIRTYSKSEKTLESVESLALRVAEMLEGSSDMPAVLAVFPSSGKKINEEMFINESVLGHKFLNRAFKANYEYGPDSFSLFIFDCKSPEEAWKSAEAYLASCGTDALESASGKYVITDGYNGTIFLAWKDSRMVVISGLSKDQADIADQYTTDVLR